MLLKVLSVSSEFRNVVTLLRAETQLVPTQVVLDEFQSHTVLSPVFMIQGLDDSSLTQFYERGSRWLETWLQGVPSFTQYT